MKGRFWRQKYQVKKRREKKENFLWRPMFLFRSHEQRFSYKIYSESKSSFPQLIYHVRYLSHLALGSSNQDPLYLKVATLAPKLADPLWTAPPLLFLDLGFLIQIDYHFVLYILVSQLKYLLRNQISLCQHVFYYTGGLAKTQGLLLANVKCIIKTKPCPIDATCGQWMKISQSHILG